MATVTKKRRGRKPKKAPIAVKEAPEVEELQEGEEMAVAVPSRRTKTEVVVVEAHPSPTASKEVQEYAEKIVKYHKSVIRNAIVCVHSIGKYVDEFLRKVNEDETELEELAKELSRMGLKHYSTDRLMKYRNVFLAFEVNQLIEACEKYPELSVDSVIYISTKPEEERVKALEHIVEKKLTFRQVARELSTGRRPAGSGGRPPTVVDDRSTAVRDLASRIASLYRYLTIWKDKHLTGLAELAESDEGYNALFELSQSLEDLANLITEIKTELDLHVS